MPKDPKILFKSETVLVRLMALLANEIGQRHYHSSVFETVICTEGKIALCASNQAAVELFPGQQASVLAPKPHHVQNLGQEVARYPEAAKCSVVQGGDISRAFILNELRA